MRLTTRLIVPLALMIVATAASGQEQPGSTRARQGGLAERFKQLDRNGDGEISAEEFPGPLFKQMDKDGDGFVTLEEARAYFATRRTRPPGAKQPGPSEQPSADSLKGGDLLVVDAVFELCVRDVEACARFYRDGIGMREVEPAQPEKGALLEWAGSYLRLREVPGIKPEPATGSPMKQMLSANGFRWFSLWFNDPAVIGERLVKVGYHAPRKGGNVSMTRDPDGNVVEIMGVPRSVTAETFTWGMAVNDEAAARTFYGEVLGLKEYDPWNLPVAGGLKMCLFSTGGRGPGQVFGPAGTAPARGRRRAGRTGVAECDVACR